MITAFLMAATLPMISSTYADQYRLAEDGETGAVVLFDDSTPIAKLRADLERIGIRQPAYIHVQTLGDAARQSFRVGRLRMPALVALVKTDGRIAMRGGCLVESGHDYAETLAHLRVRHNLSAWTLELAEPADRRQRLQRLERWRRSTCARYGCALHSR